jgi:hypothetical protein
VKKDSHLHYLRHAIREFAGGEGFEECSVYEDVLWLPECADEILPVGSVDRRLSAHTRVNHGQESGRDLHETHTAHAKVPCVELTRQQRQIRTHNVAATYPTRSPMTPPPSATTTVSRVHLFNRRKSSIAAFPSRLLDVSPGGIVCVRKRERLPERASSS